MEDRWPTSTGDGVDPLILALAEAMTDMVDCTCADMLPLWLEHSYRAMRDYAATDVSPAAVPSHIKAWKAPKRSKYRALAGWRTIVIWKALLTQRVTSRDHTEAMHRIYFSPCANLPPYSHSKATTPILKPNEKSNDLRWAAEQGCLATVKRLRNDYAGLCEQGDPAAPFVALGLARSLRDVLRVENHVDVAEWKQQLDLPGLPMAPMKADADAADRPWK